MSKITDFAFKDVLSMAVHLFGHDEGMEGCENIEELREEIGDDGIGRIVEALDNE